MSNTLKKNNDVASRLQNGYHVDELISMFEHIATYIWVKNADSQTVELNPAAAKSMGLTREEVIGKTTAELFPEMAHSYQDADKQVLETLEPVFGIKERYTPLNQPEKVISTDKIPYIDKVTGEKRVIVIAHDISEQESQRLELERTNKLLSLAEKKGKIGHWVLKVDEPPSVFWSDQIYEIYGLNKADGPPSLDKAIDFYHPDDVNMVEKSIQKAIEHKVGFDFKLRLIRSDGSLAYVHSSGMPIFDPITGDVIQIFGTFQDMTKHEDIKRKLETNAEKLKQSNEDLEQFAFAASHDLRAPLRAVLNLTDWLSEEVEEKCSSEAIEYVHLMKGRIQRLDAMLNSLLQFARLDNDDTDVSTVHAKERIVQIFEEQNVKDHLSLKIKGDNIHLPVSCVLFDIVIGNLIGNVAKHHDKETGRVEINISSSPQGTIIDICDDGPGIAPEHHHKIFQVFSVLQARDKKEASGMGLALVKKAVEKMNGTIVVISNKEERGSVFRLSLPAPIKNGVDL